MTTYGQMTPEHVIAGQLTLSRYAIMANYDLTCKQSTAWIVLCGTPGFSLL